MSETHRSRERLARFCTGVGIDIGFGGDPITPSALTMDLCAPYARVGKATQHLRGDARNLSFVCPAALDFIYSSHLIEDFTYRDQVSLMWEWRRVLKMGAIIVVVCPDEKTYSAHCRATGQTYNRHHKEADLSLETFKQRAVDPTGPWAIIHECALVNTYSWELVIRKERRAS